MLRCWSARDVPSRVKQRGVRVLVGHRLERHAEELAYVAQHLDGECRQLAHSHLGHILRAQHLAGIDIMKFNNNGDAGSNHQHGAQGLVLRVDAAAVENFLKQQLGRPLACTHCH